MYRLFPACEETAWAGENVVAAPTGTKWLHGIGVEIGAHNLPIESISPLYIDRFTEFAGSKCLVDIISGADALPFRECSLDYIASSHVFEHLSNPILALCDWYRVLKPGGIIYMVVPDRRFTFDHLRKRTSLSHLVHDFENNTTSCDPTHIGDFINNVDLSMMMSHIEPHDIPAYRKEHKLNYLNAVEAGREINIHFHVFEKQDVIELVEFMKKYEQTKLSWNIVEVQTKYPSIRGDGFLIVIKKNRLVDLGNWLKKTKLLSGWRRPMKSAMAF